MTKIKYTSDMFPHLNFHHTYNITDSSKLSTYISCPRKYFFEYLQGYRGIYPNKHLVYGTGLHEALEHIILADMPNLSESDREMVFFEAYKKFLSIYRKDFPDAEFDIDRKPKSPDYVLPSLLGYYNNYKSEWVSDPVVATELHGKVPIGLDLDGNTREMTYRMDAVRRFDNGQLYIQEHKTGGQAGSTWYDKWELALQPLVYYHACNFVYPKENVFGVVINGIIAAKRKTVDLDTVKFHRVNVRYTNDRMHDGLELLNHYCDQLERDMQKIKDLHPTDKGMNCFHKNPNACTDFNTTCRFLGMCSTYRNPLKAEAKNEAPIGMKIERWNPLEEATNEVTSG